MTASVTSGVLAEGLERDAEVQRIAHLLGVRPDELVYLSDLPSAELRDLRDQITANLFDTGTKLIGIAAATKILPGYLSTSIGQKVFGPLLVARIAGLVEPHKAVDLAGGFPDEFLAEVAVELDPRRVAAIIALIPATTVANVTRVLIAREEWLTMGSFYCYLPDASIRAAIAVAEPIALLRIALVLDDKSRLSQVLEVAGPEAVGRIRLAAEEHGYSEHIAGLAEWLSPAQRQALGL